MVSSDFIFTQKTNLLEIKESTDKVIGIVVVFLFGAFIVFQTFYSDTSGLSTDYEDFLTTESYDKFQEAAELDEANNLDSNAEMPSYASKKVVEDDENAFYHYKDSTQLSEESQDYTFITDISHIDTNVITHLEESNSQKSDQDSIIEDNDTPIIETTTGSEEVNDVEQETQEISVQNEEASALENLSSETEYHCGIIVGSYQYPTNQEKIISRLKSAGYKAFGYREKGYHIAAIRLPCDAQHLRMTLEDIQEHFTKSAFIIAN